MSRKENCGPAVAFAPHQHFEPLLVDGVEPREGLVEHDQVGRVDDRSDELDHLRHALRHLADLFVDHALKSEFGHEDSGTAAAFAPVEPTQGTHECDRLARFHAGVKTALFREIADAVADRLGLVAAQQAADPFAGIDNAQRHAQACRLAGAVGA